jgi:predicted translin family RNA/ssDNA-binding protein
MDLQRYRDELAAYDQARDQVIRQSRTVLSSAKKLIYALHRNEDVAKQHKELLASFAVLQKITTDAEQPKKLQAEGAYHEAAQEYAEACIYYDVLKDADTIRSATELSLDTEDYLIGLCDVSGEMVRRAVNAVIDGRRGEANRIRTLVSDWYTQMLGFDLRNSHLRKKVDGMKYAVQKIEDVIYDLSVKGRRSPEGD